MKRDIWFSQAWAVLKTGSEAEARDSKIVDQSDQILAP